MRPSPRPAGAWRARAAPPRRSSCGAPPRRPPCDARGVFSRLRGGCMVLLKVPSPLVHLRVELRDGEDVRRVLERPPHRHQAGPAPARPGHLHPRQVGATAVLPQRGEDGVAVERVDRRERGLTQPPPTCKFTSITPAVSNLAFSGRTPEINLKETASPSRRPLHAIERIPRTPKGTERRAGKGALR